MMYDGDLEEPSDNLQSWTIASVASELIEIDIEFNFEGEIREMDEKKSQVEAAVPKIIDFTVSDDIQKRMAEKMTWQG